MAESGDRVSLTASGLSIGDTLVPLLAGSVHYWRLERRDWRACLTALRRTGFRLVDVYVPWSVHEQDAGRFDFGTTDPRLAVADFLHLAHELELYAIVRPGPHINAELTCFGIPERVIWDPFCQAKSARGNPVVLPALPLMFPVPSYASQAYIDEAVRWLTAVARELAPLCHPHGPIVLSQIDNEGALYFRDGPFDQDYHPDAIALYRGLLRDKYTTLDALARAYQLTDLRFADIEPPHRFEAERIADLPRYLDWLEAQEELVAAALRRFAKALEEGGVQLPTSHNFPLAHETTPLDLARVGGAVEVVGYDYYYRAGATQRAEVARRTSELALYGATRGVPAFACEMGAGFPPFFPPLSERDSAFTVLCALAYGLKGFNAYMAVERDRWIGAPIDMHGRMRTFADFWRRLNAAIERTGLHRLRRRVPVRLLVPRIERRLARLLHAFGSASPALLAVMGHGVRERCFEQELDLGHPLVLDAEAFARAFEEALEARGIPFACCDDGDLEALRSDARWIVCATSGILSRGLTDTLSTAAAAGVKVTLGPHETRFDSEMRPMDPPRALELLTAIDPARIDRAVARAVETQNLPSLACDPEGIHATVHEDESGRPRVLFAINASDRDVVARITIDVDARWEDVLDAGSADSELGTLEVRLLPWTVRMLART
ncbi:MAG TPA: beta-galactosidase [Polyangiaceae bacterium]|nr:beta-galactosidase [Polyangiaceae bacterium]